MPKATIVASNYNHARRRRLDSIERQTFQDFVLIPSDDSYTGEGQ